MDIMLYVNLIMYLISFIATVHATDVIITIRGELNDLRED